MLHPQSQRQQQQQQARQDIVTPQSFPNGSLHDSEAFSYSPMPYFQPHLTDSGVSQPLPLLSYPPQQPQHTYNYQTPINQPRAAAPSSCIIDNGVRRKVASNWSRGLGGYDAAPSAGPAFYQSIDGSTAKRTILQRDVVGNIPSADNIYQQQQQQQQQHSILADGVSMQSMTSLLNDNGMRAVPYAQLYQPANQIPNVYHPQFATVGSQQYYGNFSSSRPLSLNAQLHPSIYRQTPFSSQCAQTQSIKSLPMQRTSQMNATVEHPPYAMRTSMSAIQHRERMLAWANAIYRDLLAANHQFVEQRHSQHAQKLTPNFVNVSAPRLKQRKVNVDPRAPKMKIYQSPLSTKQWTEEDSVGGAYKKRRLDESSAWAQVPTSQITYPNMPVDNVPMNTHRAPANINMTPVHNDYSRPPASHILSPQMASAITAIDALSRLCAEGYGRWIDGMLLVGRLWQAIGAPMKAQHWYQQVLAIEPNQVEALSCLGTSLMSIGSSVEAEKLWWRCMKLKPNHFDAIEQLVSYLCLDKRSAEAVAAIEFMEASLKQEAEPWRRRSSVVESPASDISMCLSNTSSYFDDNHKQRHNSLPSPISSLLTFPIAGNETRRLLHLAHAKGNILYAIGDNAGAAKAFSDAVMMAIGQHPSKGIARLMYHITDVLSIQVERRAGMHGSGMLRNSKEPVLLSPDRALQTKNLLFPPHGELPGLSQIVSTGAKRHAVSTTSNSLLSLAKIYQDAISNGDTVLRAAVSIRDILALYYLSLSLFPSPSTANNVGILLASVQQIARPQAILEATGQYPAVPGCIPGSGSNLALTYYSYGLQLDSRHAHLYTNLGSLLKDMGQLGGAIRMYEQAVSCDGKFDIALANLANAVKDQGRVSDAIGYYKRAVHVSPDFAEAVCGLANALNSVCDWTARGGIVGPKLDRWHVDDACMLYDGKTETSHAGWMTKVVQTVKTQLAEGENWGNGVLTEDVVTTLVDDVERVSGEGWSLVRRTTFRDTIESWRAKKWQGAKVTRLVERATKKMAWRWYHDKYVKGKLQPPEDYQRPKVPINLSIPCAPTVLPFHTFTCPLSADQVRMISQRNALRISNLALRAGWLPPHVFPPPPPPKPHLNVGYVSSDFNNHPLAHLMQSVFGFHDPKHVKAFCYATSLSDNSPHRIKIELEAPVFHDASEWSNERLVKRIVEDEIHILVNLNGFTRGARNEVFAARPAPLQMSFMGFAGTLGAEWCDYIYSDTTAIPASMVRPWKRKMVLEHIGDEDCEDEPGKEWVYTENIIYSKHTFFCNDHRQSAPDSQGERITWEEEVKRRWEMRKLLFPQLGNEQIIFGNFNQLYKIEPTTFRTWLRILSRVPNAILWLLRFPDLGEANLIRTAKLWAGEEIASRIIFTDVAPKNEHISRARVCDLFLDTPECNAHTTAADVLWSGTPLLTLPRHEHKMCSRIAASILRSATNQKDAERLICTSEDDYEQRAVEMGRGLEYDDECEGRGSGELANMRRALFEGRWRSEAFDTRRWVKDLEGAYEQAWGRWVAGEEGNIWLDNA